MIASAQAAVGPRARRGTVVPLLAFSLVALVGFMALAIDLGMMAVAKTQTQQAADLAALTAARTLSGDSTNTYNNALATTNAQNILSYNVILGQSIQASQLQLSYGSYDYSQSTQAFTANYPATSGVPYTAVSATVTASNMPGSFSTVFGSPLLPTVTATAQAVHRPRDVALVMDLSGSMRMGTCLGFDFYTATRTTNNPDTAVPTFAQYSAASPGLIGPSTTPYRTSTSGENYTISPSNATAANTSYTLTYVNNFYSNAAYATTLIRAFDSYTSTDGGNTWVAPAAGTTPALGLASYATVPGGDVPMFNSGSTSVYATCIKDFTGSTSRNKWWELDGYSGDTNGTFNNADLGTSTYPAGSFYGYTKGPGYYGKTFMIWPPDPRRPLNTGTATSWSSIANDQAEIYQFLQDFGYSTSTDFNNSAFTTTLNGAITSSATSIVVNSSTAFPIAGLPTTFPVLVDSEIMIVTAASGTGNKTWTVQRGKNGTTAASHTTAKTVGLLTGSPLCGIFGYTSGTSGITGISYGSSTTGSQTWPWPSGDTGAGTATGSLSKYLTTQVYIPSSPPSPDSAPTTARLLQTTDRAFQKIMRLYNWNYVLDNTGTTPCDWRIRFFGTNDNTKLFTSAGSLNPPGSTGMCSATATYNAILSWLTQSNDPFPTQLRAGRVKYYGTIPNGTTTPITGSWPSYGGTDQRFWVEVIDNMLGFRQTSAGSYTDISAMTGYGSDFTWGTKSLTAPTVAPQHMTYTDNPLRPELRCWFGALTMTEYLQNFNMWCNTSGYYSMQPGDTYEAPIYNAKQAFLAAVTTMEDNHPNDWFTLVPFSWPRTGSSGSDYTLSGPISGRFNCVSCPLGTNYAYASSALLFPFSTIKADGTCNNTEITPYDADPTTGKIPSHNFVDTPRADGETCFAMALMLAYNQFAVTPTTDTTLRTYVTSTPITFPPGMAGGQGRKGAQKVIIFETDGIPNTTASATLTTTTGTGAYSYYPIRYDMNKPTTSEYPSATVVGDATSAVTTQIQTLITQLQTSYGTTRNPFRLYTIGFGPVFSGTDASTAEGVLQSMQYWAGTQSLATTALPSSQIITGTGAQMSANMTTAYTTILQNGVQVALIK